MEVTALTATQFKSQDIKPQSASSKRLLEIDRARGLAILFVVLGHISDPNAPGWASIVKLLIYNFHMPFFMYLSGYVFVYVSAHMIRRNFAVYVLNRANRLLVPFLVMAVVMVSLKMLGSHFTDLNRADAGWTEAYTSILIHTQQSPALDLWYLFVLFVFSVATPLLYRIGQCRFWPVLILSLAMYALFVWGLDSDGLTDDFYISRMCWFYVFFLSGCLACRHSAVWLPLVDKSWPFALVLFVAVDLSTLGIWTVGLGWRFLVIGLLSAVALHGLARSRLLAGRKVLLVIAESTLAIYLFNTIFIAVVRAIFVKFADPADNMWALYAVSVPVGLLGPMLVRRALASTSATRPVLIYIT